ncbi:MAG: hypothetical protein CVV41_12415 [Candidatus Riflebacteria bacterium HGW-Riflebacteria-1]|jgi:radical SAM superfamily enzyme YgiQ (UPF0313 family)|nr:MAG: hypothetical protein CVV41_12415 [Candidatus Riflebacteria bacterium HGW-Riflebacteria-1]
MSSAELFQLYRPEDIVFVINPSLWYQSMYPTGILCLSSYLEVQGVPSLIVDSGLHPQKIPLGERERAIIERLQELKPKVVCFSCTHMEFDEVVRINSAIKAFYGQVFTIVGGSQPTYRTSDFLDNGFDFVCIGEGEKTLHSFVEQVLKGDEQWQTIEGLAWKQNGNPVVNPPRQLMAEAELNFDLISSYKKIDPRYFDFGVEIIRGLPMVGALLLTTRGCPFSCSFCGCNSIFGRKLRFRPIESIKKEVSYLTEEKGVEGIWILDDTFTVNRNHATAVAKILADYNVIWGCQSRVDSLTNGFVAEMKSYGCIQMDFGVESGSQRILDEVIGKKIKVGQVIHSFELAKKHRIRTLANFIIGFPTETLADLAATRSLADQIRADIYVFSIAIPLPGTRLYEMVGEEIHPKDYSALNWNGSLLTGKLNKSEIKDVVRERQKLKLRYLIWSILKSIFSLSGIFFIVSRKHRLKRTWATFRFLLRNLLGLEFL